ncbi:MAG: glycosyltransferase [Nonlabens sp.]|uniref:glycosyltransferase n=1 Tax=Nonlabens sp. TaxID=1888209 RepID=UPI003EFB1AC1
MKFIVITDAHLVVQKGQKVAYAPYVREMDLWMSHLDDVTFVCPDRINGTLLSLPFKKQEFHQIGLRRLEFHTFLSALISFFTIPYQAIVLWNAMRKADHIHLRCPGNLALLASLVQITLPRKRKTVKYAGNFSPSASQPLSYRWQKKILSNTVLTKNIDVLVYGEWPNQTKNIKPFFTATYSEKEKGRFEKEFKEPYQFIFVGTLSQNKNPKLLVELVKQLIKNGILCQAHFYGDGPMMEELKEQSSELIVQSENLSPNRLLDNEKVSPLGKCPQDNGVFSFYGNQPSEVVKQAYKKAHFSFLASQSEGWPKAVAESMWYGCIPIATPVSCVPWMVGIGESLRFNVQGSTSTARSEAREDRFSSSALSSKFRVQSSELRGEISNSSSSSNSNQNARSEALEDRHSSSSSSETYSLGLGKGFDSNDIGSRGIIFKEVHQTTQLIKELIEQQEKMTLMSQNAQDWSQEYTLDKFEREIVKLLQS